MPKYKSHLIRSDEMLPNGARKEGLVAWEPLNDAAKAEGITELAVHYEKYTPSSPKERETVKRNNKVKMYERMRRDGKITEHQLREALNALKDRA